MDRLEKDQRSVVVSIEDAGLFARVEFVCGHVVTVDGVEAPATCPQCQVEAEMMVPKEHRGCADDSGGAVLNLRTSDHPAVKVARGAFITDARVYFVRVPLEDGRTLMLEFGAKGRANLEKLILQSMLTEDRGAHDAVEDRPRDK